MEISKANQAQIPKDAAMLNSTTPEEGRASGDGKPSKWSRRRANKQAKKKELQALATLPKPSPFQDRLLVDGVKLVLEPKFADDEREKYIPGDYSSSCLTIDSAAQWRAYRKTSMKSRRLDFGGNFIVTNARLDLVIAKEGLSLRHIDILNTSRLKSETVIRLAKACGNLIHVGIDNASKLKFPAAEALLTSCNTLEYLRLSSTEKFPGRAGVGTIFTRLTENPAMAEGLKKLELTNQIDAAIGPRVEKLMHARPELEIVLGDSSGAVQVWSREEQGLLPTD